MKKLFSIVVFMSLLVIPVFAQTKSRFAVTLDPFPLIVGPIFGGFGIASSFEWAPIRLFSTRLEVYYLGIRYETSVYEYIEDEASSTYKTNDIQGSYFKIYGEGRYYPLKTAPQGLFLNLGLGFMSLEIDNSVSTEEDSDFKTFFGDLGLGYKITFNRKTKLAFFLEPSIKYHVPFTMNKEIHSITGVLLGVWGFGGALTLGLAF
jgi:hypothetical protein